MFANDTTIHLNNNNINKITNVVNSEIFTLSEHFTTKNLSKVK